MQPDVDVPTPATAKLAANECELVAASAKMHIRVLHAQLSFLHETSSMDAEIRSMMAPLIALVQQDATHTNVPQTPVPPPPIQQGATQTNLPQARSPPPPIEVLHTPEVFLATAVYIGENSKHIVAKPGDRLVVCAWADNKKAALAYNRRNNTAGRISAEFLDTEPQHAADTSTEVHVVSSNIYYGTGEIALKLGDFIRIFKWDDRHNGLGFNLSTKEIGRFNVATGDLKPID